MPLPLLLNPGYTHKAGSIVIDVGNAEDGEGLPSGVTAPK